MITRISSKTVMFVKAFGVWLVAKNQLGFCHVQHS